MKKFDKTKKAFNFFKGNTGKLCQFEDIVSATGWSSATVKTYMSKKWSSFLLKEGEQYRINNFELPNEESFAICRCSLQPCR